MDRNISKLFNYLWDNKYFAPVRLLVYIVLGIMYLVFILLLLSVIGAAGFYGIMMIEHIGEDYSELLAILTLVVFIPFYIGIIYGIVLLYLKITKRLK